MPACSFISNDLKWKMLQFCSTRGTSERLSFADNWSELILFFSLVFPLHTSNENENENQMGDASLSNVEETIIVKHTLVESGDRLESTVILDSPDAESFIPTAIVHPKYQKLSFDERQLPVCGSTDDNTWHSQTNPSSTTTITTTPRKVQKHLPKSQKSFAKQTRKLVNRSGENCVDYDGRSDRESISLLRHREKDIDCCVTQNSIAIVQPLKKVVEANASVNMGDEKHQNPIDCSINSNVMSHKHEQKTRNSSKIIATNEIAARMSECGNNNFNTAPRKVVHIVRESEKKVPTKKKELKDNSGWFQWLCCLALGTNIGSSRRTNPRLKIWHKAYDVGRRHARTHLEVESLNLSLSKKHSSKTLKWWLPLILRQ